MVSAVFHGPFEANTAPAAGPTPSAPAQATPKSIAADNHPTLGREQKSLTM